MLMKGFPSEVTERWGASRTGTWDVRSAQLASSAGPGSGEHGAGEPAWLLVNLTLVLPSVSPCVHPL